MTRFRNIENGYKVAPKRGRAPAPPPGYIATTEDPFVFMPDVGPCEFREKKSVVTKCCVSDRVFCHKEKRYISLLECVDCTERQEGENSKE